MYIENRLTREGEQLAPTHRKEREMLVWVVLLEDKPHVPEDIHVRSKSRLTSE